jgi:hypothetical protein
MVVKIFLKIPIIDAGFALLLVHSNSFCWVPEQNFTSRRDKQMSLAIWQLIFMATTITSNHHTSKRNML